MKLDAKQLASILAIVFGILIFALPDILQYLVALFFIIWGIIGFIPAKKK